MKKNARLLIVGAGTLALAFWFLQAGTQSSAADDKALRETVLKMADKVGKNGIAAVKDEAKVVAKTFEELGDVMHFFSLRKSKGLGIGPDPEAIKPDGIEKKLEDLSKQELSKKELEEQAKHVERAAYVAAAISEIIQHRCPVEKKEGNKDPKEWAKWAQDMGKNALELAEAAKAKDANRIQKAADKLNNTCVACHGPFRE